jgi:hypothetical protein
LSGYCATRQFDRAKAKIVTVSSTKQEAVMDTQVPQQIIANPTMLPCRILPNGQIMLDVSALTRQQVDHSDRATSPSARNEDRFVSQHISKDQVWNVLHGIYFANQCGLRMNGELVLTFRDLGCRTDQECYHSFGRFLDRFRAWCNQTRSPAAYFYCWERARDRGLHVHLQLHVPADLQVRFREWVYRTASHLPGSAEKVGRPFLKLRRHPTLFSQWAHTRYLLKGINPDIELKVCSRWVRPIDVGIHVRPAGDIGVKRVGVSQMLGADARRRSGYDVVRWEGSDPFNAVWSGEGWNRWERGEGERLRKFLKIFGSEV